ncbi:MAG: VanZ family protein [Planctomycetota bacterium]|jgi:hypothetical protein
MKLHRRHKSVLIALGIYWPVIFILTHVPVQDIARKSGMSDKVMHALAYFVLTFFVWFAVSPYRKVQWNKLKVWIVLAIVAAYGAVDEILQGFVGRSSDMIDFIADVFGLILALGILSIFNFWSAMLTFSAIFVFVVSNMSNLLMLYPQYHLATVFHYTAYTAFALIWIQHTERYTDQQIGTASWLFYALMTPTALLVAIKGSAIAFDQQIWWVDIATAMFGITSAVLISYLLFKCSRREQENA